MIESAPQVPQVIVADLLRVSIPNWKKFNPRADRVNFSWFRMENRFFEDQSIFYLNDAQKILYLFILCSASKKNTESFEIRIRYASAMLQRPFEEVHHDFFLLADLNLIEVQELDSPHPRLHGRAEKPALCRQNDGIEPSKSLTTLRNVTRRDVTKNNTLGFELSCDSPKFDFESVYVLYPKRLGSQRKADGMSRIQRIIKTQEEFEQFKQAVVNYANYCRVTGKENTDTVMQFKTFVNNNWKEYINKTDVNLDGQKPQMKTFGQMRVENTKDAARAFLESIKDK